MSDTQLNYLAANAPFLQGIPNSHISPEWFRLLMSLTRVGITVQNNVTELQTLDVGLDDPTGLDADAVNSRRQLEGQLIDQGLSEGNEADALARAQQASDLADQFLAVNDRDGAAAIQEARDAIEQLLQEGMDSIASAMQALQDAIVEQFTLIDVIRSMASQDAGNVAITGGAVDGTPVGAATPSTGAFTTLAASGAFGCNGAGVQTKVTFNAASTDLASVIALCNQIRTALISNGIGQ